ncbi:cold-shock protein [Pseudarthrobacter sp. C4D7]|uniref:cold-shock protein n=1 Tax=Pseudarthrobacter sp. C4D7 TaxID=2735268 RepID=UPI0015851809|nr:cold-shock protein [Pseudarthrobacter sp. C4D7]NUT71293.1 cold-shock protein [Pseudarthrobacter sp. C4D7]
METGIVRWFSPEKGVGFIIPDNGSEDVFAHFTAVLATGQPALVKDLKVEFSVTIGPGGPVAENIRVL